MIVLGAGEPPPSGPWVGLGLAAFWLAAAVGLVRLVLRAYDHAPGTEGRAEARPSWWRIRLIGYFGVTAVPLACASFCFGFSMVGYSAFLWTGNEGAGVASVLLGFAGLGCFFWALLDSFGPLAWRQKGRDEHTLW